MKPSNQVAIFGYIENEPPIAGTYRAAIFELVERAEETVLERDVVARFAEVYKRMRQSTLANALRILDIEL